MGTWSITTPVSVSTLSLAECFADGLTTHNSEAQRINGLLGSYNLSLGGAENPWAASGVVRFGFDQTTAIISLDGAAAIAFNALPAGFTALSGVLSIGEGGTSGTTLALQFDEQTEGTATTCDGLTHTRTLTYDFTAPAPTMLDIITNGIGFNVTFPGVNDFVEIGSFTLTGTYSIVASAWYYNPTTEHFAYEADPGSPWVANSPVQTIDDTNVPEDITDDVEAPLIDPESEADADGGSPSTTLFTPGVGCSAGGTSVAITGTGFGDGATVKFASTSATSVVVVNSHLITCVSPAHADGAVNIVITQPDASTITGTNAFVYGTPWWQRDLIVVIDHHIYTFQTYVQSCTPPDTGIWVLQSLATPDFTWWLNTDLGYSSYQVDSPGSGFTDTTTLTAASTNGWYQSPVAFGGSINVISAGRPKNPRTWANISVWAAAGTAMLGGSPAASVIFQNRMIYPASDYTVGTTYPTIRVFDGLFDHELCKLPPTTLNVVPKAVMSMLAANGTMYVSSFDSGTTSADWLGRVFELSLESGVLTPLGTQFAAGEMPYALCWHMDRLWCGTNNGIGTVGKVYYFRPGIDTTWTLDYSLATSTVGGVDSLCSYKGLLYVGSDGAAGVFAKLLVRSALGAYTTSYTGTGGTARVNNGILTMREFGGNLYASYWNADTTAISLIKKFDNASWSTVYTAASNNLRPYILLFVDDERLFAAGGGYALTGALISSANGTSWTDLTPTLAAIEGTKTLLPIFGVEIL